MIRKHLGVITAAILVSLIATSLTAVPQAKGLLTQKAISLDMAQAIVQGAIEKCRADNFRISVQVLDGSGLTKAGARDDGSGQVNYEVSHRKAFTALTYKRPSSDMEKQWATMSPGRIIEGTIGVGGGLPIQVGGETIGAVGVGGAPGSDKDEACAAAGLAKVADQLK
jgi:uncharacterized protein GlcG (DUF336 family)